MGLRPRLRSIAFTAVQTRYLILASLAVGLLILAATAVWFSTL